MPRKKKSTTQTPLSKWLNQIMAERGLTARAIAAIAEVSPSVVSAWRQNGQPSDTIPNLRKLANHFGYSLTTVLTGEPDSITVIDHYQRIPLLEGLCEVKITRLVLPERKK